MDASEELKAATKALEAIVRRLETPDRPTLVVAPEGRTQRLTWFALGAAAAALAFMLATLLR